MNKREKNNDIELQNIGLTDENRIPSEKKKFNRKALIKWCLAGVSFMMAIAIVITVFFDFNKEKLTENNVGEQEAVGFNIPSWYTPGDLSVITVLNNPFLINTSTHSQGVKAVPLAAVSSSSAPANANKKYTSIALPENAGINPDSSCDADYISISSSSEYPGGTGIYYDIKNQKTICFSAAANNVIKAENLIPSGGYINTFYSDPVSGNCLIDIRNANHSSKEFYFYNIYDNRLSEFPVNLNSGKVYMSPNKKYYIINIGNDIFLIDVSGEKATKTKISKTRASLTATSHGAFSDNGKYVLFNVYGKNGDIYDEDNFPNWALYNIEKQTTIQFTGNFVRFIDDNNKIIVQSKNGGIVMNSDTGEDITAQTELDNWQKYRVRVSASGGIYAEPKMTATLISIFDNMTETTPIKNVNSILEADQYIYYYNNGEAFITCYNIDNGESFKIPVDEFFLDEIKSIDQTKLRPVFCINISKDKTKLLLYYTTDKKIASSSNTSFTDEAIGELFRSATCLKDLEEYIRLGKDLSPGAGFDPQNNPLKNMLKFYLIKGNGYTSIVLIMGSRSGFVAVEDYRDKTFSLYFSQNEFPWDAVPRLYDGCFVDSTIGTKPYRKALNSSADQNSTMSTFSYLKEREPYYDYADFYTNGKIDKKKTDKWLLSHTDLAYKAKGAYINYCTTKEGITYGRDIYDRDSLSALLNKIASIDTEYKEATLNTMNQFPSCNEESYSGKAQVQYYIRLSVLEDTGSYRNAYEFFIGTDKAGKEFIYTLAGYAFIDKTTYDELLILCKKMY